MKKALRIFLFVFLGLAGTIAILVSYVKFGKPNIPVSEVKIEYTPERLERGKYLATSVMGCMACHAERDWSAFMGPVISESVGAGGEELSKLAEFPGQLISPNITPYHLGDWTDGELFRAITAGVSKDGRPLFPLMPYQQFGKLDKEDIYSVIVYIRSLEPKKSDQPVASYELPLSLIVHLIPQEGAHHMKDDPSDPVKHGEYMITAAACIDCHTPQKNNSPDWTMAYAGGFEFKVPTGGIVRSANLTPDPETGIGRWTREQFMARFKAYSDSTFVPQQVKPGNYNTVMPYGYYSKMKDEDLAAIFDYLMSLKPVHNQIIKFTPPES